MIYLLEDEEMFWVEFEEFWNTLREIQEITVAIYLDKYLKC